MGLLAAQAQFDGEEQSVHRRIGGDEGTLFVDLADETWRAVAVRHTGAWEMLERSPVPFVRDAGTRPLPPPEPGGTVGDLRQLANLEDGETWTLVQGALLAMFHPTGPYFVTLLQGAPGSGKTALARYLAQLVDPHEVPFLNGQPRGNDLIVAASRSWLVGLDNVSRIDRATSDLLCALSTGAGDRRRALYTNADPFTLKAKRPIIVTSIGTVAGRPDLVDRSVPIQLDRIPDQRRRTENHLDALFRAARPRLFGAVLDALAGAMKRLPTTALAAPPRMADVARFVTAAEPALGIKEGTFHTALSTAQGTALQEAIQASPFIETVIEIVSQHGDWEGTATALWEAATKCCENSRHRSWPRNASDASKQLDEHEIALQEHGVRFTRERRPGDKRERRLHLVMDHTGRDAGRTGTDPSGTA